ncbi:hypothetical protein Emag_004942 [Eimeria magna]
MEVQDDHRLNMNSAPSTARYNPSPSIRVYTDRDWAYWPAPPEPRGYRQSRPWVWLGRIPKWQQMTARIICCVALLALFIMCLCITIREVQTERRLAEDNRQRQQELKEKREMQASQVAPSSRDIRQGRSFFSHRAVAEAARCGDRRQPSRQLSFSQMNRGIGW